MNIEEINLDNTIYQKFLKRIKIDKNGCWLFTKSVNPKGYATFGYSIGRGLYEKIRAHRYSFEIHKGKIPESLVIDHLCRVKNCVNPEHLDAVTQEVNINRGEMRAKQKEKIGHLLPDLMRNAQKKRIAMQLEKTHCKNGHLYTPETTRMYVKSNRKNLSRACLLCRRATWHRNKGKLTRV